MTKPFYKIIDWYFSKNALPYWCVLLLDSLVVFLCGCFTYWLFHKTAMMVEMRFEVLYTLFVYVAISWIGFRLFRTYSGVVRYSSFIDLMRVAYSCSLSMLLSLLFSYIMEKAGHHTFSVMTQTEVVVMFIMAMLVMWAVRVVVKSLYEIAFSDNRAQRVLIYGAMSGGIGLAKNINTQKPKRFTLCGFISHNSRANHMLLMGQKVYNVDDDLEAVVRKKHIKALLVSPLRTDDIRRNQKLLDTLIGAGVKIYMAQPAKEATLQNGQITADESLDVQLHEVSVEDLLPREEIRIDMKSVGELLKGRCVLITGAAGSIGSEMVRQVATYGPSSMVLIDQAETPQHDIRLLMARDFPEIPCETVVTSICKQERMEMLFKKYRPEYVFHAAAYKHVPMMEDNPSEAVQNNIYGTMVIADLSVKYGVKKFVMVSTDKAVNPTNVMGCSKRICEIYVQALDRSLKLKKWNANIKDRKTMSPTQFVTTRFGNVLGSNGSVIPLFREQIKSGGPITVTHPDIIRFFMLIPEACKLVLEAGTKGNGGEIFVFDMGEPVKIADLAKRMIALSNAKGVKIEFTGLREGEKLYEEVLNDMEGTKPTFHEKIRIAEVREYDYEEVKEAIDELVDISRKYDNMATVKKMKEIVPEYKSNNSVYEELDKK